jgi:2-oxoglutarate dehydrogenase E2 component (dihydrolipoamide succinyltransferase)
MATPIVIPNVGESVTSGVVSSWRKKDGERVERDDVVLDLETDKITMEVRAPASGALKQLAKEGDQVDIGAVVGEVDEARAGGGAAPAKAAPKAETPKNDAAKKAEPARVSAAPTAAAAPEPARTGEVEDVRATPLAKKLAEERGVDISRIKGTGAGNRVREQDVLAFVQSGSALAKASPVQVGGSQAGAAAEKNIAATTGAAQATGGRRGITRERMSPLRQRVASRLVEAQHTAAMLTTFNECDMSAVMAFRTKYKEDFEKRFGVGLGFMSFFVRAAVNALEAYPLVNASIVADEKGQPAIEKHDYCDVAIAVASPKGLVVPVIRSAETLGFAQIEAAVKDLAVRAKDGKLTLEEMQGGTFTITNGGIFGSLMSTPILNPPQSAILGMHTIKNRAVEDPDKPGQVVIRPMMYLAVSYDHRIIDGAEAVRFLVKIKEGIEDPRRLLLEL